MLMLSDLTICLGLRTFPTVRGVQWFNLAVLVVTPTTALYGLYYVPVMPQTMFCALVLYVVTMLGQYT